MSDFGIFAGGNRFDASRKLNFNAAGSANTMGSWTQLVASTAFDACGFYISLRPGSSTAQMLADVGVGGSGAEVIIAPKLFFSVEHSGGDLWDSIHYVPIAIPRGTRVALRGQCTSASRTLSANVILVPAAMSGDRSFGAMTEYNIDTSISSAIRFYSAGSWQQVTASCVQANAFMVLMGNPATVNAYEATVDIGVGASGSEVAVMSGIAVLSRGNESYSHRLSPRGVPLALCNIPAGERIAIRMNTVGGSTNVFGVALYFFT